MLFDSIVDGLVDVGLDGWVDGLRLFWFEGEDRIGAIELGLLCGGWAAGDRVLGGLKCGIHSGCSF